MSIVRVIDFETTGLSPPEAEVCEYAYCDIRKKLNGEVVGRG